ncbi:MAG: heparan-alpha-glucosaminide N-acetyltransferase domain-containing protein [Verrucomicrobiota bacterium]
MVWLDLYRGMAVVLMIETHVLNTFLIGTAREGALFSWLNFFNGLVAPAFLFIAGYLQGLGMRRNRGVVAGRKWLRLLGLAAISYAMHLPTELLRSGRFEEALRIGSQVDVLQCLAVSLAFLLVIQRWAGRAGDWILALSLAAIVGGAAPLQAWQGAPVPLLAFVNQTTGSLFPLFPWTGFVIAGALASRIVPPRHASVSAALDALLPAAVFIVGYVLLAGIPYASLGVPFFLQRLAWVLGAAWAVKWLSVWIRPLWLQLAGRESLTMYVGHLVLISFIAGGRPDVARLEFSMAWSLYGVVLVATWLLAWGRTALVSSLKPVSKPAWNTPAPAAEAA